MRKLLYALAFVATIGAGNALADCNGAFVADCQNTTTTTNNTGIGVGVAGAQAGAEAAAVSGSISGASNRTDVDIRNSAQGFQWDYQKQQQANVGLGSGNKTEINQTWEAAPIPTGYTIRNTPGVALGGLYPSAPCMGTSNLGGSGPGLSLAFGTSWIDTNCQLMETARFAPTDADKVAVWCQSEYAKNAPSCKSAQPQAQKKAETTMPAPVQVAETRKRKTSSPTFVMGDPFSVAPASN